MTDQSDHDYFRRREQAARALAARASDAQVAAVHHQLADLYAQRVAAAARSSAPAE